MSEVESTFNPVDFFSEPIIRLFSLETKKIQSIIDAFNKKGYKVSSNKLAAITGMDSGGFGQQIRHSLSYLAHHYINRKKSFERDLSKSKLDKAIVDKLRHFMENLNDTALNGLEMVYATSEILRDKHLLSKVEFDLMLKQIHKNNNVVGYIPLIYLNLESTDGTHKNTINQRFFMTLDNLNSLISTMKDIYKSMEKSTKDYQDKLGDSVLLIED